jgi:hypothetical protein
MIAEHYFLRKKNSPAPRQNVCTEASIPIKKLPFDFYFGLLQSYVHESLNSGT